MTGARRRTLVTGAAGFVGGWLVPHLHEAGDDVVGALLPEQAAPDAPASWIPADLRCPEEVARLVRETRPSRIVHLAAISFPPDAERDPAEGLRVNYGAVDSLLCAVKRFSPSCRVLYVGTGASYGGHAAHAPARDETAPLRPDTLYAATKAAAEVRCSLAAEQDALDVVRVRPFNHTGRGRPDSYVESSFARQIARIERGEQDPVIRVGNLDTIRDFSDVRDVVRAYTLLLDRGVSGEVYNVCSGRGRRISEILELLLDCARVRPRVERDPARFRAVPTERLALVGNPDRMGALGWRPVHDLGSTLADLVDHWREAR